MSRHLNKLTHSFVPLNENGQVYLFGFPLDSMNSTGNVKIGCIASDQQNHELRYDFVLYSLNIAESCNTSFLTYSVLQYVNTGLRTDVGLTVNLSFKSTFSCFLLVCLGFKGISLCFACCTLLKTEIHPQGLHTRPHSLRDSLQLGFLKVLKPPSNSLW